MKLRSTFVLFAEYLLPTVLFGFFTIVFCPWFEAIYELTPAGIAAKAIVSLIALATKADTFSQQNYTWLWYVDVMWNRHVLIL